MRRVAAFPGILARTENVLAGGSLVLSVSLLLTELLLRNVFGTGVPGTVGYVQNLTLWIGFLGAVVATREGRHLRLGSGILPVGHLGTYVSGFSTVAVAAGLAAASVEFVWYEAQSPARLGGWMPNWVPASVLPFAFTMIAIRTIAAHRTWRQRLAASSGLLVLAIPASLLASLAAPSIVALLAAGVLGTPLFVVLGGVVLVLHVAQAIPIAAIPIETYRIIVSPVVPTIPLFALVGYLLAGGGANDRLIRLFKALFGWMPGGAAIVATFACAFFSTFTGASGVTIMALAGVLLPVLLRSGYQEKFSLGLLTATGSIGLLFPPSIAVILYAVVARVPVPDLFIAGVIPGTLMVLAVCVFTVSRSVSLNVPRTAFDLREAADAIWASKWEIMLPVVALVSIFGGFASLMEAAAITVGYTLLTQVFFHRDLHPLHEVPRVFLECATVIGGVFVVLGVALGMVNYLVDADVPAQVGDFVRSQIESPLIFLLALNLFLLAVGSMMDIFAAIVVVVPIILPISQSYGIHPIHLGIIFLVNLEIGFMTPPIGMNIFLASFRFNRPIGAIVVSVLPFLGVLLLVLAIVTYVPALTLLFVD